jgi:hypothetical protein
MQDFPVYKKINTESLIPYARNSRTHNDAQVDKIAASIKEFGFLNPVIVDGESGIVAGHGRVMAAKKLGMKELPVIEASHLTDAQRRAYVIADNRLALDAGWDDEMLRVEFDELGGMGFDLTLTGFELTEINEINFDDSDKSGGDENPYTQRVDSPTYTPEGDKPYLNEIYNNTKTLELIESIKQSGVGYEEQQFLIAAAQRHTKFNFSDIANYYAHSGAEMQQLMEDSALVIIDFEKAIENGYVKLNQEISSQYIDERGIDYE